MNLESYQKNLHYSVMGIGLTVRAVKPNSHLYKILDEVLDHLDWVTMHKIRKSFDSLPSSDQGMILAGYGKPLQMAEAITRLEMKIYLDACWPEMAKDCNGNGITHLS